MFLHRSQNTREAASFAHDIYVTHPELALFQHAELCSAVDKLHGCFSAALHPREERNATLADNPG